MLQLVRKSRFKKDFKKLFSSGNDLDKLASVIRALQAQEALPERNRDHALTGNYPEKGSGPEKGSNVGNRITH